MAEAQAARGREEEALANNHRLVQELDVLRNSNRTLRDRMGGYNKLAKCLENMSHHTRTLQSQITEILSDQLHPRERDPVAALSPTIPALAAR